MSVCRGSNGSQWSGGGANDPFAEVKNRIHLSLVSELGPQLFEVADVSAVRAARRAGDPRAARPGDRALARGPRATASEIADDIFGYGPLERLLGDPRISEIMVNGASDIWVERNGRLSQTSFRFSDESHLRRIITKMVGQVGRRIDESSPMVDARLPDGSRVNAIVPPLSLSGALLTIRKFAPEPVCARRARRGRHVVRAGARVSDRCRAGRAEHARSRAAPVPARRRS